MPFEDSSRVDRLCTRDPEHTPHLVSECAAPTPPYTGQRTAEQQAILHAATAAEEPPLTPEEEEEAACAHESWNVTSEWYDPLSEKWHRSRRCNDCGESLDVIFEDEPHFPENEDRGVPSEPEPPQPERRPPYAVAYSAGGHLYEVMLPGDATASAVDGRLIIEHPDFQVLGIVRVLPVQQKEAS